MSPNSGSLTTWCSSVGVTGCFLQLREIRTYPERRNLQPMEVWLQDPQLKTQQLRLLRDVGCQSAEKPGCSGGELDAKGEERANGDFPCRGVFGMEAKLVAGRFEQKDHLQEIATHRIAYRNLVQNRSD